MIEREREWRLPMKDFNSRLKLLSFHDYLADVDAGRHESPFVGITFPAVGMGAFRKRQVDRYCLHDGAVLIQNVNRYCRRLIQSVREFRVLPERVEKRRLEPAGRDEQVIRADGLGAATEKGDEHGVERMGHGRE